MMPEIQYRIEKNLLENAFDKSLLENDGCLLENEGKSNLELIYEKSE